MRLPQRECASAVNDLSWMETDILAEIKRTDYAFALQRPVFNAR